METNSKKVFDPNSELKNKETLKSNICMPGPFVSEPESWTSGAKGGGGKK